MSTIIIKIAPRIVSRGMYDQTKAYALVKTHFHEYEVCPAITVVQSGESAADEAFDLTNNPSRQDEREIKYGRGPSVSVGDIVEVDGVNYICMPLGWRVL
jgi:hypothetical protein